MPHTNPAIIPHLTVNNASTAIDFYKNSLGFAEASRLLTPDGKILHCVLMYGDQALMLNESF
jgi:PhnB protein